MAAILISSPMTKHLTHRTFVAGETATPRVRPAGDLRMDWRHALRALRRLLADTDDTVQAFEILRALNGRATARNYRRLVRTPEGGRIAYERAEFSRRLADEAWLAALPAGSVGAAYRDWARAEAVTSEGLVEVSRVGVARIEEPHPYAWFARRTRDVHDVWHVLTGYGRESLGEACLVAFSYAQTGGLGWAVIGLGAALRYRDGRGWPARRALLEGYRRGRGARWLLGEDYERLMREPLGQARERLGLATPGRVYSAIAPEVRAGYGRRA